MPCPQSSSTARDACNTNEELHSTTGMCNNNMGMRYARVYEEEEEEEEETVCVETESAGQADVGCR